ncbi:MAG: hypothetical protein ACPGQV_09380 [Alphaproteobacteria bacterium]
MFDDAAIAHALHVLGVVLWIGGVAFVTTVLLPAVKRLQKPEDRVAFFEAVKGRFAWQARGTTVLVGFSGFYMVDTLDLWSRFTEPEYWWLDAMSIIWVIFTIMLFVAEPLFIHRWFRTRAAVWPEETFRLI